MNSNYRYLNLQPLGMHDEDCVCRAISLAVNEDYYKVDNQLKLVAQLLECDELCVCCYKFLIEKVYGLIPSNEFKGMAISDFLNVHPEGIYIIRINGHLTCAIDGVIFDIWDCSEEIIDMIWF